MRVMYIQLFVHKYSHLVLVICPGLGRFRASTKDLNISVFPGELWHNCPAMTPLKEGGERFQTRHSEAAETYSVQPTSVFLWISNILMITYGNEQIPLKRIGQLLLQSLLKGEKTCKTCNHRKHFRFTLGHMKKSSNLHIYFYCINACFLFLLHCFFHVQYMFPKLNRQNIMFEILCWDK